MRLSGGLTIATIILVGACDAPQVAPGEASAESIARGREAAIRHGCGACHKLPGIGWPEGRVGPDLSDFAGRASIAGRLPNRPDTLAHFVRDAPSLVPGTAMPVIAMPVRDAQDISAWLQSDHGQ